MKKKKQSQHPVVWMILVPTITIIVNIVFGEVQNDFGIECVIISVLFLFLTYLGIMFIYHRVLLKRIANTLDLSLREHLRLPSGEISSFDSLIDGTIIKDSKLAEYEKECCCEEIWVISNDLETELEGGLYADIVPNNLERGIKYKVFAAPTNQTMIKIEQLKRLHKASENISYYVLDNDFFFLVSHLDFTVYDPYKNSSTGRKGYIGFDLPGTKEIYAAKVSDGLVDAISSQLLLHYITDRQ